MSLVAVAFNRAFQSRSRMPSRSSDIAKSYWSDPTHVSRVGSPNETSDDRSSPLRASEWVATRAATDLACSSTGSPDVRMNEPVHLAASLDQHQSRKPSLESAMTARVSVSPTSDQGREDVRTDSGSRSVATRTPTLTMVKTRLRL